MGYFDELSSFANSKAGKIYKIKADAAKNRSRGVSGELKPEGAARKKGKPEKIIEDAILKYLKADGWLAIKFNSGQILNPHTGAPFRAYFIANTKKSAGMSDILAAKNGRVLFLEVKTKAGRQSPSQKDFEMLCHAMGNEYYVVRSVEEVEKIVLGN